MSILPQDPGARWTPFIYFKIYYRYGISSQNPFDIIFYKGSIYKINTRFIPMDQLACTNKFCTLINTMHLNCYIYLYTAFAIFNLILDVDS